MTATRTPAVPSKGVKAAISRVLERSMILVRPVAASVRPQSPATPSPAPSVSTTAPAGRLAPGGEVGVAVVLDDLGMLGIVERAAADGAQREGKAGRMDDVHRDAEAGAQPQHGAGVLGDIGLVEGKVEGDLGWLRRLGSQMAVGIVSHEAKVTQR